LLYAFQLAFIEERLKDTLSAKWYAQPRLLLQVVDKCLPQVSHFMDSSIKTGHFNLTAINLPLKCIHYLRL
jgi:hypothetical protein